MKNCEGKKMDNKRSTIDDVAKLAGVSKATVSYVLNYSDKKISHNTRIKVFAAAEELNYVPDRTARNLSLSKTQDLILNQADIGIVTRLNSENSDTYSYVSSFFLSNLSKGMSHSMFNLGVIDFNEQESISQEKFNSNNLDLVILNDLDLNDSIKLKEDIYIPILFLNSCIEDTLFHKINFNYEKAFEIANADTLIASSITNDYFDSQAENYFFKDRIYKPRNSKEFYKVISENKNKRILFSNDILASQALNSLKLENIVSLVSSENNMISEHRSILKIKLPFSELIAETVFAADKLLMMKGKELEITKLIEPEIIF